MDAQLSDLLLQDCETLLDFDSVSDAGYYSACDGLSPASSRSSPSPSPPDSGTFSWPSPLSPVWSAGPGQEISKGTHVNGHTVQLQTPAHSSNQEQTVDFQWWQHGALTSNSQPIQLQVPALPDIQQQRAAFPPQPPTPSLQQQQDRRLSRARCSGKKRQSASEREKLRMRDLTKALHHLRTYLPASVAPEGQTLTKIQTLRLAARYIAHLSAQLQASSHMVAGVKMEQAAADVCQNRAQPRHAQECPQDSLAALIHVHGLQQQPSNRWSHRTEPYTHPLAENADFQQNRATVTNCLASAAQQDITFGYQQRNLMSTGHDFYCPLE